METGLRLKAINGLAQVVKAQRADVKADYVLGIGGFDLDRIADEVRDMIVRASDIKPCTLIGTERGLRVAESSQISLIIYCRLDLIFLWPRSRVCTHPVLQPEVKQCQTFACLSMQVIAEAEASHSHSHDDDHHDHAHGHEEEHAHAHDHAEHSHGTDSTPEAAHAHDHSHDHAHAHAHDHGHEGHEHHHHHHDDSVGSVSLQLDGDLDLDKVRRASCTCLPPLSSHFQLICTLNMLRPTARHLYICTWFSESLV